MTPPDPAECRARHLQTMLQSVEQLPAHDRDVITRSIPQRVREAIAGTTTLGWVDMRHNVDLTRVIATGLGPKRSRAFFRGFLGQVFESPLMRNFMQATLRISQRDVALGLRFMPKGYDLIFRNVGRWAEAHIEPTAAHLRLEGLPPMCMQGTFWIESVAGSLESVYDLGGREGSVDIVATDLPAGRVEFALRWEG